MARTPEFKLNTKGVGKLLKQMGPLANAAAQKIGAQIAADHPELADDINIQNYTTDRGAASVMVRNSRARELQVREGLITKAATKVGLEVKHK